MRASGWRMLGVGAQRGLACCGTQAMQGRSPAGEEESLCPALKRADASSCGAKGEPWKSQKAQSTSAAIFCTFPASQNSRPSRLPRRWRTISAIIPINLRQQESRGLKAPAGNRSSDIARAMQRAGFNQPALSPVSVRSQFCATARDDSGRARPMSPPVPGR